MQSCIDYNAKGHGIMPPFASERKSLQKLGAWELEFTSVSSWHCVMKNMQRSGGSWKTNTLKAESCFGEIKLKINQVNAVFAEQGTSSSSLASAKMVDLSARLTGNSGEDADATSAYTQTPLGGPVTWISLPKDQRPSEWARKFRDPVVILSLNLYGHPLAGLYWELYCHNHIKALGFEHVVGWECLFVHKKKQLFLSVYVDDFKMAGKTENLAPMWKELNKRIELDPPVPLNGTTYLGCTQFETEPSSLDVAWCMQSYTE